MNVDGAEDVFLETRAVSHANTVLVSVDDDEAKGEKFAFLERSNFA